MGELIVVRVADSEFPPRCVVCNQPAVRRLKRRTYWHDPIYFGLLAAGPVYLIGALLLHRRASFEMGLCQQHSALHRNGRWIGTLGSALCLAPTAIYAWQGQYALACLCVTGVLLCLLCGIAMTRLVRTTRIDKGYLWLKVDKPFLDSIGY